MSWSVLVLSEPMMGPLYFRPQSLRKWAAWEYYELLWLKMHLRFRPQLPRVTLKLTTHVTRTIF